MGNEEEGQVIQGGGHDVRDALEQETSREQEVMRLKTGGNRYETSKLKSLCKTSQVI